MAQCGVSLHQVHRSHPSRDSGNEGEGLIVTQQAGLMWPFKTDTGTTLSAISTKQKENYSGNL